MAMNLLEQEQGLAKQGWGSADHMHAGIEAMRLSFADALSLVADPEVTCCPYFWGDSGGNMCHFHQRISPHIQSKLVLRKGAWMQLCLSALTWHDYAAM